MASDVLIIPDEKRMSFIESEMNRDDLACEGHKAIGQWCHFRIKTDKAFIAFEAVLRWDNKKGYNVFIVTDGEHNIGISAKNLDIISVNRPNSLVANSKIKYHVVLGGL